MNGNMNIAPLAFEEMVCEKGSSFTGVNSELKSSMVPFHGPLDQHFTFASQFLVEVVHGPLDHHFTFASDLNIHTNGPERLASDPLLKEDQHYY